jgi:hypothetical protein
MNDADERTQRVERWLSIAVGLAAIVAVVVSLYQASLARQQLKASAWPYISQGNGYTAGNPYIRTVGNDGVGPARIKSFRVVVDGRPVQTWNEAVRALTGEGEPALVYSSLGRGTVLVPGASRTVLSLPPGLRAQRFWLGAQTRLRTQVCFCSIYEECWLADSEEPEPTPQRACMSDSVAEFRQ